MVNVNILERIPVIFCLCFYMVWWTVSVPGNSRFYVFQLILLHYRVQARNRACPGME